MIYNNPKGDENNKYFCTNCNHWWRRKNPFVTCAILHIGKGCCHYGETMLEVYSEYREVALDEEKKH